MYRLRPEGARILYATPIELGTRLRDIIELGNGRIAILSDYGRMFVLREKHDADKLDPHGERRDGVTFSGYSDLPAAALRIKEHRRLPSLNGNSGAQLFAQNCAQCHFVEGSHSIGPYLAGIVGRTIGSAPGYSYSAVLRNENDPWTPTALARYIANPQAIFADTKMAPPGVTDEEAKEVVEFLAGHPA